MRTVQLISCLALVTAGARGQTVPVFRVGTLESLSARISPKAGDSGENILVLEVTNRGDSWAEPLEFRCVIDVPPDPQGRFREWNYHRVPVRTWGRAGRAVGPGRTARFYVPAPWGGQTPRDRVRVQVRRASFFVGRGVEKAPVVVGDLGSVQVFDDVSQSTVTRDRVSLRNTLDAPVDVLLAVTAKGTRDPILVSASLAPGETRWVGYGQSEGDTPDAVPLYGAPSRFEAVRLLDWSVLLDPGHGDAQARFLRAYERRSRWAFARDARIEAPVQFRLVSPQGGETAGQGRFVVEGRTARLDSAAPLSEELRQALNAAAESAASELILPAPEEVLAGALVELLDRGPEDTIVLRLRFRDPAHPPVPWPIWTLKGDRCLAYSQEFLGIHWEARCETIPLEDGQWFVESRVQTLVNLPLVVVETEVVQARASWVDGHPWLAEFSRQPRNFLTGEPESVVNLRFGAFAVSGALEPGRPVGDGVSLLRSAWNRPWTYPSLGVDLEGTLEVECSQTAETWAGQGHVRGPVRMGSWRANEEEPKKPLEWSVASKMSQEARGHCASLVQARLGIWTRQDFCARRSFDQTFQGCSLTLGPEPGVVSVSGHGTITSVRVGDGLPVEVAYSDGSHHLRRFAKVDDVLVPAETRWVMKSHTATFTCEYRVLGKGLLFPAEIVMQDWFSQGWGPETYRFRVRAERSR